MRELGPSCKHCNKPLPPDSLEVRICTYECTFCATCVTRDNGVARSSLDNVGSRTSPPQRAWRDRAPPLIAGSASTSSARPLT